MYSSEIKSILTSFVDFASPRRCELCGLYLGTNQRRHEFICDECFSRFPPPVASNLILERINKFYPESQLINYSFSLFPATEKSDMMELIYSLKYRGFSRIGKELGYELGELIKKNSQIKYDFIIPVPIHHARLRERGFNQSELISLGISNSLLVKTGFNIIKRAKYTQTQTKLNAVERKKNVEDVFIPANPNVNLSGKNVLLIDDVFTTGSTLYHCAKTIKTMGANLIDTATLVFISQ
ncbi:MAG: ComF family protein [Ignavibacteriae bacterium]|nr:ComF family protein [Ignavibacteriota bacterium]